VDQRERRWWDGAQWWGPDPRLGAAPPVGNVGTADQAARPSRGTTAAVPSAPWSVQGAQLRPAAPADKQVKPDGSGQTSPVLKANMQTGHRKPRRPLGREIVVCAAVVCVITACAVGPTVIRQFGNSVRQLGKGGSSASAAQGKLIPTCAYEVTINTPAQNEGGDPFNLTINGTGYVIVSSRKSFTCSSVGSVMASGQWWDTQNDAYDSSWGTDISGSYGATVTPVANPETVYEQEPNGLECRGSIGNYVVSVYDYGSVDQNSEAVAICNDWDISSS
jgi:hypothetical protein